MCNGTLVARNVECGRCCKHKFWLAALFLALGVPGCDRSPQAPGSDLLARTRNHLATYATELEQHAGEPDDGSGRFGGAEMSAVLNKAIVLLDSKKLEDFENPTPYVAYFSHQRQEDVDHVALSVYWLESGFRVSKVVIAERGGDVVSQHDDIKWSSAARKGFPTLDRDVVLAVALDGEPVTMEGRPSRVVDIPKNAFSRDLTLELRTADGFASPPLEIFVPDSLKALQP